MAFSVTNTDGKTFDVTVGKEYRLTKTNTFLRDNHGYEGSLGFGDTFILKEVIDKYGFLEVRAEDTFCPWFKAKWMEPVCEFEVGDTVIGIDVDGYNPYGITNAGYVGTVESVDSSDWIRVNGFPVNPKYFKLHETAPVAEPKPVESTMPYNVVLWVPDEHKPWSEKSKEARGEILVADQDGEQIQFRFNTDEKWRTCKEPTWRADVHYRVTPPPTPEMEQHEAVKASYEKAERYATDLRSHLKSLEAELEALA